MDDDNKDKKSSEYGNVWNYAEYKKEYGRQYQKNNRPRLNKYRVEYYHKNKDRDRDKINERNRTYRAKKKNALIAKLTRSQRLIFDNLKTINHMKNNGKTWDEIALEIGLHRDTLMRALRSGVFSYEKKYILKLKELKK